MARVLLTFVLALFIGGGGARKHGAPYSACESMAPQHGVAGSAGNPGYTFSHDMCQGYQAGKLYEIVIAGPQFQGFFCRVQKEGTVASADAVGKWDARFYPTLTRASSCGKPSTGVTHIDDIPQTDLTFKWEAPATNNGTLQITCTMAHTPTQFYVALRGDRIRFNPSTATIGCTLAVPTAAKPIAPTSAMAGAASALGGTAGNSTAGERGAGNASHARTSLGMWLSAVVSCTLCLLLLRCV